MRLSLIPLLLIAGTAQASSPARLPAWLLELPPSVDEVLIAATDAATLHRFENNGHGIVPLDKRYMSSGRNGAGKQRAWDRKTPLGIYFITEELDTRRLHEKYGDAAFVLDYPNAWDRHLQRTGNGIWLHGVDRGDPLRPPRDTDGCLALPNEEITRIAADIKPLVTPVIVARELRWAGAGEIARLRAEFRAALKRWLDAQAEADLDGYLSLYSSTFSHGDMNRQDWSAWREDVFRARGRADMALRDVLLLADPEERGLYMSRFTQVMQNEGREVLTQKRLYWRRDAADSWQIVTEDNG